MSSNSPTSPSAPHPTLPPQPTHNIVITIPRTASHLLTRLLNLPAQPSISAHAKDGYFFLPALGYRYTHDLLTRPATSWTSAEKTGMQEALSTSFSAWEHWMDSAEAGAKGTFVKEHVNWMVGPSAETSFLHGTQGERSSEVGDPTCVPAAHWRRVRTTFLIRHPALAFASTLRAAIDNEGVEAVMGDGAAMMMRWECTYHWHRAVYGFLSSVSLPHGAIIVDAEDLGDVEFVRAYAAAVGLDEELVRFEWGAATEEEHGQLRRVERRMKDTILQSTGVVMGKLRRAGEVDLDAEIDGWRREFGDVLAERLVKLVEDAMPDYEWLREKRFTV